MELLAVTRYVPAFAAATTSVLLVAVFTLPLTFTQSDPVFLCHKNESAVPDTFTVSATVPPVATTTLTGALTSVGAVTVVRVGTELTVPELDTRLIANGA